MNIENYIIKFVLYLMVLLCPVEPPIVPLGFIYFLFRLIAGSGKVREIDYFKIIVYNKRVMEKNYI